MAHHTSTLMLQTTATGLGEVAGFNTDTFQILCNGIDETWNTEDDLSNFWKGTRGDQ